MGLFPEKFNLPDEATIKEINNFKKKINWGEIPAFFQVVANAIADAEGFINYGFDNAYKRLVDRKNWNYDVLGIDPASKPDENTVFQQIEPLRPPKICLYHVFNTNGYELLAFPYVNDSIIDEYRSNDKNMDFLVWDPSQMKVLVRIPQFHKFIAFTLRSGDDGDKALVIHAHNVVNKIISMLQQNLTVNAVKGMTIAGAFKLQNENMHQDPEQVIITSQLDDEFINDSSDSN